MHSYVINNTQITINFATTFIVYCLLFIKTGCLSFANNLCRSIVQIGVLYTSKFFKFSPVDKTVSFTSDYTKVLQSFNHRVLTLNLSVVLNLLPTFHTTNKCNYKVYKLITC